MEGQISSDIRSGQIRCDPIPSDPIRCDPIRSDQIHRIGSDILVCVMSMVECVDTDNGALDSYGESCSDYTEEAALDWTTYGYNWCGVDDDDDFDSMSMCCACQDIDSGGNVNQNMVE